MTPTPSGSFSLPLFVALCIWVAGGRSETSARGSCELRAPTGVLAMFGLPGDSGRESRQVRCAVRPLPTPRVGNCPAPGRPPIGARRSPGGAGGHLLPLARAPDA